MTTFCRISVTNALLLVFILLPLPAAQAECSESESKPRHGSYFENWFLSQGVCLLEDEGKSILSDKGKELGSAVLELVVPGSASVFGLADDDKYAEWSRKIMDLVSAEAEGINDHIDEFWSWMKLTQSAHMQAEFGAVQDGILAWRTMTTDEKLWQVGTLNGYVDDLNALRHGMSNVVEPIDRLRWLDAYTEVVDLSLVLVAEQAMLSPLLPYSAQIQAAGSLEAFRATLSAEEQQEIQDRVEFNTEERWEIILHTGTAPAFAFLGGVRSVFDEIARDRFGEASQCVGRLPTSWSYTVDNSSDLGACEGLGPDCSLEISRPSQIGPTECNRYTRVYSPSASFFRSTMAESPVEGTDLEAMRDYHRWLVYGDMLLDGYSAIRRRMDVWWRKTRSGYRPYRAADEDLDMFLDGASPHDASISLKDPYRGARAQVSAAATLLVLYCTSLDGFEPHKRSVAIGYGLESGAGALLELCAAAQHDPLAPQRQAFDMFADLMFRDGDPEQFFRERFAAKLAVVL